MPFLAMSFSSLHLKFPEQANLPLIPLLPQPKQHFSSLIKPLSAPLLKIYQIGGELITSFIKSFPLIPPGRNDYTIYIVLL